MCGIPPLHDIVRINSEAEQIGWDESKLCCFQADETDYEAICTSNNPPLPHPTANQNGGSNRQET